jgi:hypothetical protein
MILADLVNWVLNHPSRAKFADWSADDFANVLLQAHCRNQLWYCTDTNGNNGAIKGVASFSLDETSHKMFVDLVMCDPGYLRVFRDAARKLYPDWQVTAYRYDKGGKYTTYNTLKTTKYGK